MKHMLIGAALAAGLLAMQPAQALTFKSGQVIGGDGKIYDGASPQQAEALKKLAARSGKKAGVSGNQLYVVAGEEIVFIPVTEIAGKSDDQIQEIVGTEVIQSITGLPITFSDFEAAQAAAAADGRDIGDVLAEQIESGALGSLQIDLDEIDPEVIAGAKLIEESGIKDQIINSGLFDPAALETLDEQLSDLTFEDAQGVIAEVNRVQDEFRDAIEAQRQADPDFFNTEEGQALLEEAGLE